MLSGAGNPTACQGETQRFLGRALRAAVTSSATCRTDACTARVLVPDTFASLTTVFGAKQTTQHRTSAELGLPDDPATRALFEFLGRALKKCWFPVHAFGVGR